MVRAILHTERHLAKLEAVINLNRFLHNRRRFLRKTATDERYKPLKNGYIEISDVTVFHIFRCIIEPQVGIRIPCDAHFDTM